MENKIKDEETKERQKKRKRRTDSKRERRKRQEIERQQEPKRKQKHSNSEKYTKKTETASTGAEYILNRKTGVVHRPGCSAVSRMNTKIGKALEVQQVIKAVEYVIHKIKE